MRFVNSLAGTRVGRGRGFREKRDMPIFSQDYLHIGVFGHDHIYSMNGYAIQTLFTFYLAAFSHHVNSIENLDFWILLRVTHSGAARHLQWEARPPEGPLISQGPPISIFSPDFGLCKYPCQNVKFCRKSVKMPTESLLTFQGPPTSLFSSDFGHLILQT